MNAMSYYNIDVLNSEERRNFLIGPTLLKIFSQRSKVKLRSFPESTSSGEFFPSLREDSNSPSIHSKVASIDPDLEWFYSDPNRAKRFEGEYVAIHNKRVVGHGTELEADEADPDALVVFVQTPEQKKALSLGL